VSQLTKKIGRNDPCPCGSEKKYKKCCHEDAKQGIDILFSMTKVDYLNNYLPHYKRASVEPKTLIQFVLLLPFELPFPERKCITTSYGEFCTSIRFNDYIINESQSYMENSDNELFMKNYTKVEMTYTEETHVDEVINNKEDYLNTAFDQLIESLNFIITSYQVSQKDDDVHYITKEMFDPATKARIVNVSNWETHGTLFLLHINAPINKTKLSSKKIDDVMRLSYLIATDQNPFAYFDTFALSAKRYIKKGFYQEAVIYMQSCIETFIRTLYRELLICEGFQGDLDQRIEDTSFMSMIKKEIPQRIGGNWNIENSASGSYSWYRNTYKLRNRIIHAGYMPDLEEASEALSEAFEFRKWIISQIKSKKKKYPKLSEYFIIK